MTVKHMLWIFLLWQSYVFNNGHPHNRGKKVLILGGGMSGINAAKTLYDAGFTNFKVLEATSRVGGRIKEEKVGNFTVEVGAAWIYGKGSNPIYKLALKSGLAFRDDIPDEWTFRNDDGDDITAEADDAYNEINRFLNKFDRKSKQSKTCGLPDYTMRAGLRSLGWRPLTNLDHTMEVYMIDYESSNGPEMLSGSNYRINEPFDQYGSYELPMVSDQEGFSKIVRYLQEDFTGRVLFNKHVTEIVRYDDDVHVFTRDGSEYIADYVIVTFNVGVLQHREVVFTPKLPNWKTWRIDKFDIAPAMHAYMQFDNAFWDNTIEIIYNGKERGRNSLWTNMNLQLPGSNILEVSILSDDSRRFDNLNDSEIIEELMDTLQVMYPNENVTYPIDYVFKRWNSDPLQRGAWSNWPASFTDNDYELLASPVGRVHFAGEYIHPTLNGYVNGAYETGKATAKEVLKCIEEKASCKNGPGSSYSGMCPNRNM